MSRLIATLVYIGFAKTAPGTWGSLAAIPLAWIIYLAGGWILFTVVCGFTCLLGYWTTHKYLEMSDNLDPSEVIIDEVVGQWIALFPVVIGASHSGAGFWTLWPGIVIAFLAFRLFDIWKPGPVGWADRQHGALGVMLDDVIAGFAAAIIVLIGAVLAHGL